jgi:hypothetical protein
MAINGILFKIFKNKTKQNCFKIFPNKSFYNFFNVIIFCETRPSWSQTHDPLASAY